jgi:hypothetical protein
MHILSDWLCMRTACILIISHVQYVHAFAAKDIYTSMSMFSPYVAMYHEVSIMRAVPIDSC